MDWRHLIPWAPGALAVLVPVISLAWRGRAGAVLGCLLCAAVAAAGVWLGRHEAWLALVRHPAPPPLTPETLESFATGLASVFGIVFLFAALFRRAEAPAEAAPASTPPAVPSPAVAPPEAPVASAVPDQPAGDYAFLSHSSQQKDLAVALKNLLKPFGVDSWIDKADMPPNADAPLPELLAKGIRGSRWFVVLVTPDAIASKWVAKELALARDKAAGLPEDAFHIVVMRRTDVTRPAMEAFLGGDYLCVDLEDSPGGLQAALPGLLRAMELRVPAATMTVPPPPSRKAVSDLVLVLEEPRFGTGPDKERATARARLRYTPVDGSQTIESPSFQLTAPTGAIEAGELKWYLETHPIWPPLSPERVRELVESLPRWGRAMFAQIEQARGDALYAWRQSTGELRFTVQVEPPERDPGAGPGPEQREAERAATALLALPWELLHDETGYLFQGKLGVRVRRAMPHRRKVAPIVTQSPLRVLVVSPRPEEEGVSYIDHRVSVRPLVEALGQLGRLAVFHILPRPAFPDLIAELRRASEADAPYHVVHFDGHGVYDPSTGLGALVFEALGQDEVLFGRKSALPVHANELGNALRDHRVPLFFLEACETAVSDLQPDASVAARLLQCGVASVAAMSHSVLVETARRFTGAFYPALVEGHRVGAAMLAGQHALFQDTFRGRSFAGRLELQDWFVPVLYQEEEDLQLVEAAPQGEVRDLLAQARKLRLGDLPEPGHGFIGRSRHLLAAERLLFGGGTSHRGGYVVFRGGGGEGKTAIACELARWLVISGRADRAAFVSVEDTGDTRAVLCGWGEQLVPRFAQQAGDEDQAARLLEREVREERVVLVLDNLESILPLTSHTLPASSDVNAKSSEAASGFGQFQGRATGSQPELGSHPMAEPQLCDRIFARCRELIEAGAILLFTSRENLPAPFDEARCCLEISRLGENEAIELVARVLAGVRGVKVDGLGVADEEQIKELAKAVDCHARALVLLTPELARSGMKVTTEQITAALAELERKFPGQRENSLLASAGLSLRRIPEEIREKLGPLAVFRGGGSAFPISQVLDGHGPEFVDVIVHLHLGGLGEILHLETELFLRFDPALTLLLGLGISEVERASATARWTEAYRQLASHLDWVQRTDPHLASRLTILELPNLLGALETLEASGAAPDVLIGMATKLEGLLQYLGRPRALATAGDIRQRAAAKLGETWSHAAFQAGSHATERLLDEGRIPEALDAAEGLLRRALTAGEAAYPEAPYDLAVAQHFLLGRVQRMAGDPGRALESIAEARRRFLAFEQAEPGRGAKHMASACLAEEGDCLTALGRLDEAAAKYEQRIGEAEAQGDRRGVAVGKGQLGTVRMFQRRFGEALAACREARDIFGAVPEPGSVATAWHQIGMVHQEAGDLDEAEAAYQKSLAIQVQRGDRPGEAATRYELRILYGRMGRREEAVRFFREAADVYAPTATRTGNAAHEGGARSWAAGYLIQLGCLGEARTELERAVVCTAGLGRSAELWKTHHVRHDLERAAGNSSAAANARREAMSAYEQARRAGWDRIEGTTSRLVLTARQRLATGDPTKLAEWRAALEQGAAGAQGAMAVLIPKLLAILDGSRDPALAEDPELDYRAAVELKLWLESLGA